MISVRLIVLDGSLEENIGDYKLQDSPMVGDEVVVPSQFGYRKYLVKSRRHRSEGPVLEVFVMRRG